jgi:adenylylsulfate kinase-like enzyme
VHVATPRERCEERDTKGLYAKVRRGEMTGVSGVDAPYEEPTNPEIVVGRGDETVAQSTVRVLTYLRTLGIISA